MTATHDHDEGREHRDDQRPERPERPERPAHDVDVDVVRSFVNTVDVEDGSDRLASVEGVAEWIAEVGVGPGGAVAPSPDELDLARELRDALRADVRSHHGGDADPAVWRTLDDLARRLPLRMSFGPGGPVVSAGGEGTVRALADVLVAAYRLALGGDWERLKICPDDTCQWAFYDESRNRSRRWCSMGVCGNRNKVRAFRERAAD